MTESSEPAHPANSLTLDDSYHRELRDLQIELVKFQRHLIKHEERIVVLLEGRDAAGKDGIIKRIAEHLSPRDTPVVALPAPSSREKSEWYFQRYVAHLPTAAEFVLFNRSWYKPGWRRAGDGVLLGVGGRNLLRGRAGIRADAG
jgi:polyphosphate kinase 2 (PPK2 family)